MKKIKNIACGISVMLFILITAYACTADGAKSKLSLRIGQEELSEDLFNQSVAIIEKRVESFSSGHFKFSTDFPGNILTVYYPRRDSLEKKGELFTKPGKLEFLPLLHRSRLEESPEGWKLLEEWKNAGYLSRMYSENVILNIPQNESCLAEELSSELPDGLACKLVKGEDLVDGMLSLYLLDTSGEKLSGENVLASDCDENQVLLSFNEEGSEQFARMTEENIDNSIAIIIDDQVVSAPVVRGKITGGKAMISGNFSMDEACLLAAILEGGELPTKISLE